MAGLGIGHCGCGCCESFLCWHYTPKCGDTVASATYTGTASGTFPVDDSGHVVGCVKVAPGTYTVTLNVQSIDLSDCGGEGPQATTLTGSATVPECGTGTAELGDSISPDPSPWVRVGNCFGDCCWVPPQLMVTFNGPAEVLGSYAGTPILFSLTNSPITASQCGASDFTDLIYAPASSLGPSGAYGLCYSTYLDQSDPFHVVDHRTKCDQCSAPLYVSTPWVKKAFDAFSAYLRFTALGCALSVGFTNSFTSATPCHDGDPAEFPDPDGSSTRAVSAAIPWCDPATSLFRGNSVAHDGCAEAFCKCGMTPQGPDPLPDEIHGPLGFLPTSMDFGGIVGFDVAGTLCPPDFTVTKVMTDRGCQTCYDLVYPTFSVTVTLP